MKLILFRIISYIKFLIRSGNAHGLHSPFVFSLYSKGLKKKLSNSDFEKIEFLRKAFLADHREIEVRDFGAGSQKMKSSKRAISSIAKNSLSGQKKCLILYKMVHFLKPKSILELGTSLGISTEYLHLGAPDAKIISIEADPALAQLAAEHLKDKADIINDTFQETLGKKEVKDHKPCLVFIDGDHRSRSLMTYIDRLMDMAVEESCFIIDDIYWSKDMNWAWKTLIQDSRFGITVDLYHFGLLFTRQKQPKQHFDLRV